MRFDHASGKIVVRVTQDVPSSKTELKRVAAIPFNVLNEWLQQGFDLIGRKVRRVACRPTGSPRRIAVQNDRLRQIIREPQRARFRRPTEQLDPDQLNSASRTSTKRPASVRPARSGSTRDCGEQRWVRLDPVVQERVCVTLRRIRLAPPKPPSLQDDPELVMTRQTSPCAAAKRLGRARRCCSLARVESG
jgi:hypothetical protein